MSGLRRTAFSVPQRTSGKTSVTTADTRAGADLEAVWAGRRADAGGLGGGLGRQRLRARGGGPGGPLLRLLLGGLARGGLRGAGGDDVGVLVLEDPLADRVGDEAHALLAQLD